MDTTCELCGKVRKLSRGSKAKAVRVCYGCRADARIAKREQIEHPALDWTDMEWFTSGDHRARRIACVCPWCQTKRYVATGATMVNLRKGTFTGYCNSCSQAMCRNPLTPGRSNMNGYAMITRLAIQPEWEPFFDIMRNASAGILEHRLVMAAHLGRPLEPYELVDHMNGVKDDNRIENLRLYRKGKNDAGSTNGWGTFYDEWQRAEAEVQRLRLKHDDAA